jgi:hypothetical protein
MAITDAYTAAIYESCEVLVLHDEVVAAKIAVDDDEILRFRCAGQKFLEQVRGAAAKPFVIEVRFVYKPALHPLPRNLQTHLQPSIEWTSSNLQIVKAVERVGHDANCLLG